MLRNLLLIVACFSLVACSQKTNALQHQDGAPTKAFDVSHVGDASPIFEHPSRYGNPPFYQVFGKTYHVLPTAKGYSERGIASWYGTKFHQRLTSTREPYDMYAMTAAHTSLPLPTYARVTNLNNDKSVIVRVNDRGPFHDNRIIDLSYTAAKKLGVIAKGTALVEVTAITPENIDAKTNNLPPLHHKKHPEIYLQAGAFSKLQNAQLLANKLTQVMNETVHIKENNQFYKVLIGPLADVVQTDKLNELIKTTGLGSPLTIIE